MGSGPALATDQKWFHSTADGSLSHTYDKITKGLISTRNNSMASCTGWLHPRASHCKYQSLLMSFPLNHVKISAFVCQKLTCRKDVKEKGDVKEMSVWPVYCFYFSGFYLACLLIWQFREVSFTNTSVMYDW